MELPKLNNPDAYTGLYIFDFGEQVAVGYTADEIAVLLESEQFADGKVYRIHRALPDGTMELQGVPRERFNMEDGLFFYRSDKPAAQADFDELKQFAAQTAPPCRMTLQLARIDGEPERFVTAITFPAEFTEDVAQWLMSVNYAGGDVVEGGPSQVTTFKGSDVTEIATEQIWPTTTDSRSAEEVLASVNETIQRIPA